MSKENSITINGVSISIDFWKGKSEKDFIEHEMHNFDSEASAKNTWKLFQESQKPQKPTPKEKPE